ncbi:MAG: nucleotide kinase domain-containing protein [Methylobacter sp.]
MTRRLKVSPIADKNKGGENCQDVESALSHLSPLKLTAVYNSYWKFAAERQNIYFRRLSNEPEPWTTDPVILAHKFTNAYRASDRVSQYLIRRVIYRDDLPASETEVLFRILLFKFFNKIETWELLEHVLGEITYAKYKFEHYDNVLTQAMRAGGRIYSAAYIMPPGGSSFGYSAKHQNHLKLLEKMMADNLAGKLGKMQRMQNAFELLLSYPTIGDFLAYQFVTDINYSEITDFTEMEFVVPGPGARDGIKKCFLDNSGLNEAELIRLMADNQEAEFERLNIDFKSLWGRRLQLIDCQNLFCEISKYARVAHPEVSGVSGRTRIKQKFIQTGRLETPWYPPKWGINDRITASFSADSTASAEDKKENKAGPMFQTSLDEN